MSTHFFACGQRKNMNVDSHSLSASGAAVLAKTRRNTQLEAPQNHEPWQKKMLSPVAQRISSVLEKCISQIKIASALHAVLQLNSISSIEDKELSRALQEHQILAERLEMLEGQMQESDGEQGGKAGESRMRASVQLKEDIKNSVRDLLRLIRVHPDAIFAMRAELGMEVGESESVLIRELEKFHSHMLDKLLSSLDEKLRPVLYKPVSSSHSHNLDDMFLLEEEKVAIATKEVDAKSRSQEKNTQEDTQEERMLLRADKQSQSLIKTSQLKQTAKQQEIDQLNIQFKKIILENRQAERESQEENEKVEAEIEYLLQMFDSKMEEMQAKLELIEIHSDKEDKEVRELENPFSLLEVECNQIQERRQREEEKRQEEMRELELKTKAAIFVQAWWRGYCTRKALKNKGKTKKGKKGKGKKSK